MVRGTRCTAPCFFVAIRVRRSWDHPRYALSAAAGHVHWPRRPLVLGRDALVLLGRTRNPDWVGRKAGQKTRKRRLERVPVMSNHFSSVMAGPVPAIYVFLAEGPPERRGCPRQARA